MRKDFVLTNIFKNIIKDISDTKSLSKFHKDSKLIESLTDDEKMILLELIIDTQTSCVRVAFENKDFIKLDYIGSFRPSELREKHIKLAKELAEDNPNLSEEKLTNIRKQRIKEFIKSKPKSSKKVFGRINKK